MAESRHSSTAMSPVDFMNEYQEAANAHDLARTLSLIADDAVYLFSDKSSHVGKKAIGRAIQANFDTIKKETYWLENLTWLAESEQIAVCVYRYHWTGEIDGKAASGKGRGTTVIRRVDDKWRVAHEHLSPRGL